MAAGSTRRLQLTGYFSVSRGRDEQSGERESSISALSSCWAEVKMRRGVAITQRGKGEKGCIGIGNGMVTQKDHYKSYHSQN